MSRQDLSSLCGNLCRDREKSNVTLFIRVHFIYVSRQEKIMSRHRFCLLFFIMSQHKLICRSIFPVLLFNFFVSADLLHSSHVLSRHTVFCHDIAHLLYLVICVAS